MDFSAGNIAQRLLKQEIFVSSYNSETVELFLYCCEHDAPNDLRLSYLDVRARDYLIKDTDMEESLWEELMHLIKEGCAISPVLSMTFLKYHSKDATSLEKEVRDVCVELLQKGAVSALIVQNPYAMGYLGVETAWRSLQGERFDASSLINTPTTTITRETMFTIESQKAIFSFD